jgi:hypothetical protein
MPKQIVLRLKGVNNAVVVSADHVEDEGPWVVLRKGNNVVAKYKNSEVISWEIEE